MKNRLLKIGGYLLVCLGVVALFTPHLPAFPLLLLGLLALAASQLIHAPKRRSVACSGVWVVVPTRAEIVPFEAMRMSGVRTLVCGVGAVEAQRSVAQLLSQKSPSLLILAGIAGAYPGSDLQVGEVVLVSQECTADLGSFTSGAFTAKFSKTYPCTTPLDSLPAVAQGRVRAVVSNTVNVASAPFIERGEAQIENMEGAGFFALAEQLQGSASLELRAISNTVGEPFEAWNIPLATEQLAQTLKTIIDEYRA